MDNQHFKAVGILEGKVIIEDNNQFIILDGVRFPLIYRNHSRASCVRKRIEERVNDSNPTFRLIVYPKITHLPGKDVEHIIKFQVLGFDAGDRPQTSDIFDNLKSSEFYIQGIYQKIPVCPLPVVSIYKNFTKERLDFLKKSSFLVKRAIGRPSHVPLQFQGPTKISPFKFSKKDPNNKKIPFLAVKATFNPTDKVFTVTKVHHHGFEIPKHIKPPKVDKTSSGKARPSEEKKHPPDKIEIKPVKPAKLAAK